MDWFEQMYKRLNVNIVCVAYRGYSRSMGEPSEDGIMLDMKAVIKFVKTEINIDLKRVFLMGRSLGGAVAIHTLRQMEADKDQLFKGAVIENTFTNIEDMADSVFPMFKLIPTIKKMMLRLKWESNK